MTAQRVHTARVGRWVAVALVCAALAVWAGPGTRAGRAAEAQTLAEYLALRARPPAAERDPLRPLLAAQFVVGRAARLLFAPVQGDAVWLDDCAGPLPSALEPLFAEPTELDAVHEVSAPVVLLGCDEAGLAQGLDSALAEALGLVVHSGAARGQSPLGHIGLVERARFLRLAVVVSVWNFANDLGETELLRRLHTRLAPGGPIDELLAALRDPARSVAAQEAWFAARDDAAAAVVAVLGGAGFELERRARLHGARSVVVLLGLDTPAGDSAATPCTAHMLESVERALAARGVRFVALSGAGVRRDALGRLTQAGVAEVVAAVRAALE